jgi:hypothetical protein
METREVVDHEQRGKYFDRYCKLAGLYDSGFDGNSDSLGRSPVTVNLVIADQRVAETIAHRLAGGQGGDEQLALDVSLDIALASRVPKVLLVSTAAPSWIRRLTKNAVSVPVNE